MIQPKLYFFSFTLVFASESAIANQAVIDLCSKQLKLERVCEIAKSEASEQASGECDQYEMTVRTFQVLKEDRSVDVSLQACCTVRVKYSCANISF